MWSADFERKACLSFWYSVNIFWWHILKLAGKLYKILIDTLSIDENHHNKDYFISLVRWNFHNLIYTFFISYLSNWKMYNTSHRVREKSRNYCSRIIFQYLTTDKGNIIKKFFQTISKRPKNKHLVLNFSCYAIFVQTWKFQRLSRAFQASVFKSVFL